MNLKVFWKKSVYALMLMSLVSLLGCSQSSDQSSEEVWNGEGIEVCSDESGEVDGKAIRTVEPYWRYLYNNKIFETGYSNALQKGHTVEYVSEKIISTKCLSGQKLERVSVRRIILRGSAGQVLIQTELECVGSFMPLIEGRVEPNPCLN